MAKPYPQIVLFGDSLFQSASETSLGFSFQGTLQAAAIRRFDVVNRGFSGYNTANALKLLPEIFPHPATSNGRIAYLVVLFGANDAVRELPTTTQHVPLDQFKQNLIKIITHPNIVAHDPKILLVTPPPVDETQLAEGDLARHGEPTRHYSITARYAETVREAAREVPGVVLVDLWSIITELATGRSAMPESAREGGLAELLKDGLHMTGPAYRAFYSKVLPHIEGGWAHVSEEDRTGYVFPDWRVLNPPS